MQREREGSNEMKITVAYSKCAHTHAKTLSPSRVTPISKLAYAGTHAAPQAARVSELG